MNIYRYILSLVVGSVIFFDSLAISNAESLMFNSAILSRLVSYPYNDKKLADRFVNHAFFYSNSGVDGKNDFNGLASNKNVVICQALYPAIDRLVSEGMKSVDISTDILSSRNKNFVEDNAQLITSAALNRLIRLELEKGLVKADRSDLKKFGKQCITQVSCDAADKFVVQPLVEALVEDKNSWAAWGLSKGSNLVISILISNQIHKA